MSSLSWDMMAAYSVEFDMFFNRRTFTQTLTNLAFWPITILGGLGFVLNVISVVANEKLGRDFSAIGMYKFLRIYLINSALLCLVLMFNFVGFSIRLFPWAMSKAGVEFYLYFFTSYTNTAYFYSTVLNILITIERIWTLKGGSQLFKTSRINNACLLALCAVLIINTPIYIYTESASRVLYVYIYDKNGTVNKNLSIQWWFGKFSPFAASQAGKTINICLNVFRDGLLVLVEILVNIMSIYYLKVYLQKKSTISVTTGPLNPSNSTQLSNQNNKEANKKNTRTQTNITLMAFSICFLSFIEHVVVIASLIFPYTSSYTPYSLNILLCSVSLVRTIKHGSNFVILFIFNSKFRELCLKCIKC